MIERFAKARHRAAVYRAKHGSRFEDMRFACHPETFDAARLDLEPMDRRYEGMAEVTMYGLPVRIDRDMRPGEIIVELIIVRE